ncbi:NTP transferase domain-containing protein [Limosilactobacillus sp.]|jgi:CTP:phosphocholine cytidylyltransferase-like protein|uniref:NTP transferase domain-containing protein n=1 Tax=Limosilactobacillus sp. TaxID=2773925 RepID=UPI0025C2B652|nr:NTP transferase domain-containing protein [Limosilactobacillus sp.]MCI2030948.1 NTP transferase domain-containing protein [Limosilactobacillus sp.]
MAEIENAIIMAAGLGTRMRPLTYKTPKPLIRVAGKLMVESVIEGLHQNGIYDISIVVGYLAEQFNYLGEKYPEVKLINNPYYNQYNNISSLYVARNELKNTVILDGDQLVMNPKLLKREFAHSGYAGAKIDRFTDEWIMHPDQNGKILQCDRSGNDHGWRLYSLSKWQAEDSLRLKDYLEEEFEHAHHYDIYWDDIAMFDYFDEFSLYVMPIAANDIIEIDSVDQLKQVEQQLTKRG